MIAPAAGPLADDRLPVLLKFFVAVIAVLKLERFRGRVIAAGRAGRQVDHQFDAALVQRFV